MGIRSKAKNLRKRYGDFAELRVMEAIAKQDTKEAGDRNFADYWRRVLEELNKLPR